MALGPGYLGHPFVPCFTLHWNIMKLFLHQFFCIYSALFSEWKPGKKDTAYPLLQTCILWLAWDWQQPQWKSGYTNLKPSALQFFTLFAKKKLRPLKTGWLILPQCCLNCECEIRPEAKAALACLSHELPTTWAMRRSYQSWEVTLLNLYC